MKNYSRRTNQKVIRYRTPSTFRVRQVQRVASIRATHAHVTTSHHPRDPR